MSQIFGIYGCDRCGAEWEISSGSEVIPGEPCDLAGVAGQDPDDGTAAVTCGDLGGVIQIYVLHEPTTSAGTPASRLTWLVNKRLEEADAGV